MGTKYNSYISNGTSPTELAEHANISIQAVYHHAKRLGELPTKEYLDKRRPGRPCRYAITDLSISELQRRTGYTRQYIYELSKEYGRVPSLEELLSRKETLHAGRKKKYD